MPSAIRSSTGPTSQTVRRSDGRDRSLAVGEFLRRRREELVPAKASRARRTPGLRREEVAERAGVGIDWYVRLEQNRAQAVSSDVLDRVARALELDADERSYLFRLAGRDDPKQRSSPDDAHPSVRASLRNVAGVPACILGPRLDVLDANELYLRLFTGLGRGPFGRNMVWFVCCDERAPALLVDHRKVVGEATAGLRAAFARNLDAPAFLELVGDLSRRSPAFVAEWGAQRVRERTSGRKRFRHPELGALDFDYHGLASREAPEQLLTIYDPRDERSRAAFAVPDHPRAPRVGGGSTRARRTAK